MNASRTFWLTLTVLLAVGAAVDFTSSNKEGMTFQAKEGYRFLSPSGGSPVTIDKDGNVRTRGLFYADGGIYPSEGGGGGGGGWEDAINCALATQAAQSFTTDTLYTVCGKSFWGVNTANVTAPMAIVPGTGWTVKPSQNTDTWNSTRSAPGLMIKLPDITEGMSFDTPLRVSMYGVGNISATWDGLDVVIENRVVGNRIKGSAMTYTVNPTVNTYADWTWGWTNNGAVYKNVPPWNEKNVIRLSMPMGAAQWHTNVEAGTWNNGWPSSFHLFVTEYPQGNFLDMSGSMNLSDWDIYFNVHRSGSNTDLTGIIKNIRIEIKR